MIRRSLYEELRRWSQDAARKPLVLRGARQTGKTALVNEFGREFDHYLPFNLERPEDRRLFENEAPFEDLLRALFFERDAPRNAASTLIFIDEIQESPAAVASLRFFAEEVPELPVIAAGSLLDALLHRLGVSMPVGRVEFRNLFPVSFSEYAGAHGGSLSEALSEVPVADHAVTRIFNLFHDYVLVGGMPALAASYLTDRDLSRVRDMASDLLQTFVDDAGRYASGPASFQALRFAIETAPLEAGNRIRYQGFGSSSYKSREMSESLRTLERAMIVHLAHPTTATTPPIAPDHRKSPRLQFLDTGLVNMRLGLGSQYIGLEDLRDIYRGRIVEHVVGQEMLASESRTITVPRPWVREKEGSSAEVDFLVQHETALIPIEVKSGATGRLRSLHQFVEAARPPLCVRLHRGPVRVTREKTPGGTPYKLLSAPYFVGSLIRQYISWALSQNRA